MCIRDRGCDWAYVTHFCMHKVDLEKYCHSTPLSEVNNAVNSGPLFLALMTVDVSDAIH